MNPWKLFVLAVAIAPSLLAQIIQEDFNGTALGPQWQAYPNGGVISVSGGMLHLTNPNGFFPYVRIIPGLGTVTSTRWIVEARLAYPTISGCGVKFASSHNPVNNLASCANEPWLPQSPIFVNHDAGAASATHVKAGDTMISIGLTDTALHTYRWERNEASISFSLDGTFIFAGAYDGWQPNSFWIGNSCPISCGAGWSTIAVDKVQLRAGPGLSAPAIVSIGSAITYALTMPDPALPYILDVSLAGTSPGITLNPGNVHIPLNEPFLNHQFGPSIPPALFVNFIGLSDVAGFATAIVNVPALPQLVGASLSSTFVTLDASQPSGIAAVANAVTTTIAAP